ncbi:hypothetical protein EJB05_00584, partial [Eragrostis curvula]
MSSCALPALLLAVVLASAAAVRGDSGAGAETTKPGTAMDQVCGSLGGYYVTPSLCTSALCSTSAASDPCRAARDAPAVAALAVRLAARNATVAQRSIQSAAAAANATTSSAGGAEEAVRSCLRLYAGAVPALHWAAASVAAGRYGGATEVLQMAQNVAAGCEGIVAPGGAGPTALPPENGRFGDMVFVAHAVVASMATTY